MNARRSDLPAPCTACLVNERARRKIARDRQPPWITQRTLDAMMWGLPELSLSHGVQWIRIPAEVDVPVTARVKSLIDSSAMRRLARVSQLGLVSLVYPGATHTRFEHSLGVYRLAVHVLTQLARDSATHSMLSEHDAKLFLVAALLHDVGHWPYCHPLEDMHLDWIPRHEALARELLCSQEIDALLQTIGS